MAGDGRSHADVVLAQTPAAGALISVAARQAGVSERTAYRRLQDDAFRAQVAAIRHEMVERAAALLTAAGTDAVETLRELARMGQTDSVRLGSAKAIIELGVRLREAVELEERLTAVEATLAGRDAPTPSRFPAPTVIGG